MIKQAIGWKGSKVAARPSIINGFQSLKGWVCDEGFHHGEAHGEALTFPQYVEHVRTDGVWGDHLTLRALCDSVQRSCLLLTTFGAVTVDTHSGSVGEPVVLTFFAEVHYNGTQRASVGAVSESGDSLAGFEWQGLSEASGSVSDMHHQVVSSSMLEALGTDTVLKVECGEGDCIMCGAATNSTDSILLDGDRIGVAGMPRVHVDCLHRLPAKVQLDVGDGWDIPAQPAMHHGIWAPPSPPPEKFVLATTYCDIHRYFF